VKSGTSASLWLRDVCQLSSGLHIRLLGRRLGVVDSGEDGS
jgi:hypothetical protein